MTIVIGLVALGGGILQVREVIKTKGAIVCEVTGEESRKKTMTKVQKIVSSPHNLGNDSGNYSSGLCGKFCRIRLFSGNSGGFHSSSILG